MTCSISMAVLPLRTLPTSWSQPADIDVACCCSSPGCFAIYSLDAKARNYGDNLGTNPRFIEKARRYYSMNAPLSGIAHVSPRIRRQSRFELFSPFSHGSSIYKACFMIRTGCALYCCVPAGPTVVEVMLLTHPDHGSHQQGHVCQACLCLVGHVLLVQLLGHHSMCTPV